MGCEYGCDHSSDYGGSTVTKLLSDGFADGETEVFIDVKYSDVVNVIMMTNLVMHKNSTGGNIDGFNKVALMLHICSAW